MALRRLKSNLLWMLIVAASVACSRGENQSPLSSPTSPVETPQATPTTAVQPTATAEPTPAVSPTPVVATLQVQEQILTEDGILTIEYAAVPQDGWLAVFQVEDGETGSLLSVQEIPEGPLTPLTIEIDPQEASPVLLARLHVDDGTIGEFEYPDGDRPFEVGGQEVATEFAVNIQLPVPSITIGEQTIGQDGSLIIDRVFATQPGWLVVHNIVDDQIGEIIGQAPIEAGETEDMRMVVRRYNAEENLIAVLFEDAETPGGFDPEADLPVLVNSNPVFAQFEVTLPPDILAYDQPLIDGKITIDRAVSNGPGWITAYLDEEGEPGLIIGFASIDDGLNENVELVLTGVVTNRLFLNLHEDVDPVGEFGFPATDLPLIFEGEVVAPFVVHTNPGNYLVTKDQPLDNENQITIPVVVADLATWLVIYKFDEEGQPGEILAQTRLTEGINRNVKITLPSDLEDEQILAMLHQDAGTPEQFDFPGGVDIPLMRNRSVIQSPITLILPANSDGLVPLFSD